ncbi:MAG: acyl-CoA reductase [Clostridiales Family XIII bacterium]|jgi:hypothetical protein|nr:acyl-CoA reductase [Clostridiales Family XIII bacterium]
MPQDFSKLSVTLGDAGTIEAMPGIAALRPFSPQAVDFLNDLSRELLRADSGLGAGYSDVATFAFWCRKGSVMKMKEDYPNLESRLGKGIVFHSTPSNVAVNFAFSFASGLLAGNANIVRLPAKDFDQVRIITAAAAGLLTGKHKHLAPYLAFVKYPPDQRLHDYFSALCDVRVVWGGNETIRELRRSPLKPRATEIAFADRFSFSVLDADAYLDAEDKDAAANHFYNDTYFSDQNACTAPRIVIWTGEKKAEAKADFWPRVAALVREKYEYQPVQAVGKLNAFCLLAASHPGCLCISDDNALVRAELRAIDTDTKEYAYHSGFFMEYDAASLDDLLPMIDERCQTLSYFGNKEAITAWIMDRRPHGIDRVVPLGDTMNFTLVWDGTDLICAMSRVIRS